MKLYFLPLFFLTSLSLAEPAPPIPGIDDLPLAMDRGSISLASLRGKTVYLDFWASWCGPCRKSFPWMNEMHRKYSGNGLVILAVNVDRERGEASRFLEKVPAEFAIAYDSDGKLASGIGLKAMPGSYIIAPDGGILSRHSGFMEKNIQEYEMSIRSALGLDAPAAATTELQGRLQ